MCDRVGNSIEKLKLPEKMPLSKQMHAVLMFVPIDIMQDEDLLPRVKESYKIGVKKVCFLIFFANTLIANTF